METNKMNIKRITISEPYSPKEKGRVMECTIALDGIYGSIELKLANEDIEPIIPLIAQAMTNAGKAAAASLQGWIDEIGNSQPVIEHAPQPVEQLTADAEIVEDSLPPVGLAPEGGD